MEESKESIDERILLAKERTSLANERNRLANVRTYLSWVRTGLASVGGGVAIMRLLTFSNPNHQLLSQLVGGALVILGLFIFIFSLADYKNTSQKLNVSDGFGSSIWAMTTITIILSIISIILLLIAFHDN